MKIIEVHPHPDHTLQIVADDGRIGTFDVSPYLKYEAFADLKDQGAFRHEFKYMKMNVQF